MRLIDADALEKYYLRLSNECFEENEHEYAIFYDNVCAKIMEQPTAYDVEKVVAEVQNVHLPLASQTSRIVGIIRKGGTE